MDVPVRTLFLSPVSSGPFRGWSSTDLGFDGVVEADPVTLLQPLSSRANVFLEVVAIDAGLSLRSFTAPVAVFADDAGERLRVGATGNLHNHPILFIDSTVVGEGFIGKRRVVFRLVDTGTAGLLSSPEYTVTLAPVLPTRLELRLSTDGGMVSFETLEGLAYELQSASSPTGPWAAQGSPLSGSGTLALLSVDVTFGHRFFRVRSFPDN